MVKKGLILIGIVGLLFGGCGGKKKVEVVEKEIEPPPEEEVVEKEEPPPPTPQEVVDMLKMIHFDFDKYEIRPGDAKILEANSKILKDYPDVKIIIEGHCDERGTVEYNLLLGERRANAAKKYLIELGIDSTRISTVSYGKERPLDPRHCEEAWAKNRRAQFKLKE
jgi:peptidoglycan-associated lipoprotein